MNEKIITDHAEHCDFYVGNEHYDKSYEEQQRLWTLKFAEFIVEECRNVLVDVYREVPLECCGHFLYADEILAKHFYGVEE